MFNDSINIAARGTLEIKDMTSNKIIVRENNQIHPENISLAVAQSLGNKSVGPIEKMVFGNGGTSVDGVGVVTYLTKNVIGANSFLYNSTYEKIVDDNNTANIDPTRNFIEIFHVNGNIFSDLLVVCTLEASEPSGQRLLDDAPTTNGDYVFDELGIVNYDGKLLSHVIFHPVQKASNRVFQIRYNVRIQIA